MPQIALSEFAGKLNELLPVIMKEFARRQENELYKGKITLPQFLVLSFLNIQGEVKMTDLALYMHVTTAAMTGIVDRLVRDSYVVRVHNPGDRRIIKIRPTAKGSELVKRMNEQRRQMVIKIFGKITQAEREDYLRILMRIHDILVREKEA